MSHSLRDANCGVNAVQKVPLHVCSVNGNLCIDEMAQQGQVGEGQAAAVVAAPGAVGAAHGAIPQSTLLNQQRCVNQQAIQQVQMETGFSSMKQHMDRRFVTLNNNVRRFGSAIRGGFARQDPTQAADRRAAENEPPLPQPPNLPVGVEHRDPTAKLAPNLHTLEEPWTEWKFGTGGRKPAHLFSHRERGGHGSRSKKMKFCRRLKICTLLQKSVDEGRTTTRAVANVKLACGATKLVTQFSEAMRLIPNCPLLNPLPQRRQDPPPAPPDGGRGRGASVGGSCASSTNSAWTGAHLQASQCAKADGHFGCSSRCIARSDQWCRHWQSDGCLPIEQSDGEHPEGKHAKTAAGELHAKTAVFARSPNLCFFDLLCSAPLLSSSKFAPNGRPRCEAPLARACEMPLLTASQLCTTSAMSCGTILCCCNLAVRL